MRDVLLDTALRTAAETPASILEFFTDTGNPAACGLTIAVGEGRAVVVLTELPWNPGPSITVSALRIATVVLARHPEIKEDRVTWIEHRAQWDSIVGAPSPRHRLPMLPSGHHTYCRMWGLPDGPVQWAAL